MKKEIGRNWPILLTLGIIMVMIGLVGCAKPAAIPSPSPTPVPATPTPVAKPIVLKFAENEPPQSMFTQTRRWWAEEIERRTGGKVKIKLYPGGTLAKGKVVLDAVATGLADGGTVVAVWVPGKLPLATVSQNPVGSSDLYVNHMAMQDLINNYPPFQEQFARFNQRVLWSYATGTQRLIAVKPARNLGEIRGLKIRATAQNVSFCKKLGAIPVSLPFPEAYEALERHTIEGVLAGLAHIEAFKFYEVAKHLLMLEGNGVSNAGFGTINLKVWNSLSPDVQKVILEVSNEYAILISRKMIENEKKLLEEVFPALGVKIYYLSPEEVARVREVGKAVADEWAREMDVKGLPGSEILEIFLKSEEKYEAEVRAKGYPWEK